MPDPRLRGAHIRERARSEPGTRTCPRGRHEGLPRVGSRSGFPRSSHSAPETGSSPDKGFYGAAIEAQPTASRFHSSAFAIATATGRTLDEYVDSWCGPRSTARAGRGPPRFTRSTLEIRNLVVTKVSRTGISILAWERLRSQPVVQNAFAVHVDCHCRSNS